MPKFYNLYPEEPFTEVRRFELHREGGKWLTAGRETRWTACGFYLYVQIEGTIYEQRERRTPSGHIDIARGEPVEIRGRDSLHPPGAERESAVLEQPIWPL